MKRYYCTYFDRNYLVRAIALIESLNKCEQNDFELFVVCMDEISRAILKKLALPNVTPIPIHEIERGDERLIAAKKDRSQIEYYWTAGPTIILRLLERNPEIDLLTYLDSDLCFFSSPDPIFDELGADSVLIHEHRFPPALRHLELNGKYNVGLLCFRNDRVGLEVLDWWRQRCIEWCRTVRSEDGKFADQTYLNDWPQRFERVVVLKNVGAGVAPWNHTQYDYTVDESGRIFVDGAPLIFYHFHELKFVGPEIIVPFINYPMSLEIVKVCYRPYVHALSSAISVIRSVLPGYAFGLSGQIKLANYHKFLAKRSMREYIKECRIPQVVTPLDDDWDCYCSDELAEELARVEAKPQFSATVNGDNSIRVLACGSAQEHEAVCQSNPEMPEDAGLTIATSIAPERIDVQTAAIESWRRLGFDVVSLNCAQEIEVVRESFPDVTFVPVQRDARHRYGKPLVYFDEFLEYFRISNSRICGIVNSDVHLLADEGVVSFIKNEARDSMVYGPRTDIDSTNLLEGDVCRTGFDFFFFDKSLISCFEPSEFCIGMPWWDYWAPLNPILAGFQVKRLVSPFAYHVKHACRWEEDKWLFLAKELFGHVRERMDREMVANPQSLWASLGGIFSAHHRRYLMEKDGEGANQMSVGIIFPSVLEFLDKHSQQVTYSRSEPAARDYPCSVASDGENIPASQPRPAIGGLDDSEPQCDVSIVLCTKDRAELLDQMLGSLEEAASGIIYELIVVEGGSSDNTLEVLRRHSVWNVYNESKHLGPGRHSWPELYNFAFSKARGKWAMYASDDIVFGPNAVSRAVKILERQKEAVAGGVFFYGNVHPTREEWAEYGIDFTHGNKLLMNYGLVRLKSFREVGGLDEAYNFYCADTDLCYKLYESGRELVPLSGCFVRHENLLDARKQVNAEASRRDIELCQQRWSHFVPTENPRPARLLWRDDLAEAFDVPGELENVDSGIQSFWHGLAFFEQGMFAEAEQEFIKAVQLKCDHRQVLWHLALAADKCRDDAIVAKAAAGVVRLAPEFEPAMELLLGATGAKRHSAAPALCSTAGGPPQTYPSRPNLVNFHVNGQGWGGDESSIEATARSTMVREPRRSGPDHSETELRRAMGRFNKVVVWGLKNSEHSHAHIHRHFFETLNKIGVKAVFTDDRSSNIDAVENNDLVIAVDVAGSAMPVRDGVYYCLHNFPDAIHQRIAPARSIRLRTYTNSVEQIGEKWDEVTFFDNSSGTLFQPWATDLLASEFKEPITHRPGDIVFWIGSVWDDELGRGNVNEIRTLKDVLEARDIKFVHLRGISDSMNVKYVRNSLIAPAIVGQWQMHNDYLPCRMWKNISYGQLGVSNVKKFDDVFDDCTVKGRSIEEIIDNTLSLPFGSYRDMIYRQQEIVKSRHTYVNRLLNIVRAFESVENN